MSVRRLIRRYFRKIKAFAGKHRTALCVVAAVLLMGIILIVFRNKILSLLKGR